MAVYLAVKITVILIICILILLIYTGICWEDNGSICLGHVSVYCDSCTGFVHGIWSLLLQVNLTVMKVNPSYIYINKWASIVCFTMNKSIQGLWGKYENSLGNMQKNLPDSLKFSGFWHIPWFSLAVSLWHICVVNKWVLPKWCHQKLTLYVYFFQGVSHGIKIWTPTKNSVHDFY